MAVLVGLPFLAFGQSLLQGFAPIDDLFLVVQNLAIRGPTLEHLKAAFTTFDPELYIPLTLVSFQLNYLTSGLAPWSYHLINILLHGTNALLLFLILKKITGAPRASLFAAALFAVHPLNTEAVVWITARKDLLSTFFAFASTLAFLRQTRRSIIFSLTLFLCALLTKVSVVPLPVVFPLLLRIQNGTWERKSLRSIIPFLLLSGLFVGIALFGKERIVQTSGGIETFLLAPWSMLFLIGKFFYPSNLSPLYEVTSSIGLTNPMILFSFFVFVAFFVCLIFLRKKSLTLTLALTFILLSPALLTFFKAGTIFLASDRYLYLPSLGFLLFIVLCLQGMHTKMSLPKPVIAGVSGMLIAILCLLSIKQTRLWSSADILFTHALTVTPQSVVARTALAQTKLAADQPEQAFTILKEGLAQGDDIRLHLMAGNVYAHVGQVTDALEQFNTAKQIDPMNADAWFSLGSVQEQTGSTDAALANYRTAVDLDPSDVPALIGIGRILFGRQQITEAETSLRTALTWNSNSIDAHSTLADVLEKTDRQSEAALHRAIAVEIMGE